MSAAARISPCGTYRYSLTRGEGRLLGFVMLNPSTADADVDDPTIRRCLGFAKREGYDGIDVANVYAYRATDPAALRTATDAIGGQENQHALIRLALHRDTIVCAWGANVVPSHAAYTLGILRSERAGRAPRIVCLGVTKSGQPKHPLYLRGDAPLIPYGATP